MPEALTAGGETAPQSADVLVSGGGVAGLTAAAAFGAAGLSPIPPPSNLNEATPRAARARACSTPARPHPA